MKKICFGTAGKAWKGGLKGRTYLYCQYTWAAPPGDNYALIVQTSRNFPDDRIIDQWKVVSQSPASIEGRIFRVYMHSFSYSSFKPLGFLVPKLKVFVLNLWPDSLRWVKTAESFPYDPRGGGGGVTHHTTCYAPAFKKSVERGLFLDIRRRKASSTFLLKKGCFFLSIAI